MGHRGRSQHLPLGVGNGGSVVYSSRGIVPSSSTGRTRLASCPVRWAVPLQRHSIKLMENPKAPTDTTATPHAQWQYWGKKYRESSAVLQRLSSWACVLPLVKAECCGPTQLKTAPKALSEASKLGNLQEVQLKKLGANGKVSVESMSP